ncbi:hypothetical protein F5Y15DRAFT_297528 [Xylariaceae sp. FL0016]|nr:hypothetical protein F5Y15DRAFT_297528 [Xylariaceae sp. FL0016]
MSPAPSQGSATTPGIPHPLKPQRVLACVLCQQRKVRCDRKFPCANCIKHQAHCVPSTQNRPRRRRFPEKELLEQLRKYEDLLRENRIKFEPLHKSFDSLTIGEDSSEGTCGLGNEKEGTKVSAALGASGVQIEDGPVDKAGNEYAPKDIWHAMNREDDNDSVYDDLTPAAIPRHMFKQAWDDVRGKDDHLLFGSRQVATDLSAFHPQTIDILRIWQIYLDNVNPLLKVTHTPSLQGRIIEAAGEIQNIDPELEALMFSIYCVAIQSISAKECEELFTSFSQEDLLNRFQYGCQQALSNCSFLQTNDHDCLTALFLYLTSLTFDTHPRSLSCMFGTAIRIAQRMGIHNESMSSKRSFFEAEMGRRLWWALVLIDARICDLSQSQATNLIPTWNCKIPLNVNDSDLRPDMKEPPVAQERASEAIFAVVRSQLGEFLRHSTFHLDFTNPVLKPIARKLGGLDAFEKMIEEICVTRCDIDNPVHFMTIWTARGFLSRYRIWDFYYKYPGSPASLTDNERDAALSHALNILECDIKIMTSPLTKGFLWLPKFHFPLPAYIHIIQDLRRRPGARKAERAWELMSANFEARAATDRLSRNMALFRVFHTLVIEAWEAFQGAQKEGGGFVAEPSIVSTIREFSETNSSDAEMASLQTNDKSMNTGFNDFLTSMPTAPMGFGTAGMGQEIPGNSENVALDPSAFAYALTGDANQFAFGAMDWGFGQSGGW